MFGPEQFASIGQPTRDEDPRAPDLWMAAKRDYSFGDSAAGKETVVARKTIGGTHGFLPEEPDLRAACVIWGPAIRAGKDLGQTSITDVAPTIARILGVSRPSAEGKALAAAFK